MRKPPYESQQSRVLHIATSLCAGLLLLPLTSIVWAGDPGLYGLSLSELTRVKVTTSTLQDETLKSVPSSLSVCTRQDIRRLGLKNLNELINLVPGYQGSRSDDSTLSYSVSSRGRRIGSSGREILVLINGQRLNNDWTGGAGQHTNLIPIENIERVEFVRGPGSSLYGSNAMMGVINIITRSEREAKMEVGADQYRHASLQWSAEGDPGRIEVYGRDTRSDGEHLHLFEPFPQTDTPTWVDSNDPYRADDVFLRAKTGDFSLQAMMLARDAEQYYVAGYVDNGSNAYDTRANFFNVEWTHALSSTLALEGQLFHSRHELTVNSALQLSPYLLLEGVVNEQSDGTRWILKQSTPRQTWLLGWEWRNPDLIDTSYQVGPPDMPDLLQRNQSTEDDRYIRGAFGQYQQFLSSRLEITLGVRHDSYSDVGDHVSPRIGLVQTIDENNVLKALFSEAFRAPSRIETSVISPEYESNPALAPETASTGELVWLHFVEQGYFSATAFHTRIDDAIIETVTPELKRTWVNGEMRMSGLETEWHYQWNHQWQSRLAVTRLFTQEGDINHDADSLLGGSVSYADEAWTLALLVNIQSEKHDANEQDVPADISDTETTRFGGHSLYGAHLNRQLTPALDLYLHADNLFDKRYRSPANRAPNDVGMPEHGRLITAGMRLTFD
jgi:outer membrane cobalamin receptor